MKEKRHKKNEIENQKSRADRLLRRLQGFQNCLLFFSSMNGLGVISRFMKKRKYFLGEAKSYNISGLRIILYQGVTLQKLTRAPQYVELMSSRRFPNGIIIIGHNIMAMMIGFFITQY